MTELINPTPLLYDRKETHRNAVSVLIAYIESEALTAHIMT